METIAFLILVLKYSENDIPDNKKSKALAFTENLLMFFSNKNL